MLNRLLLAYLRARARRAFSEEPLDFWQELGKVRTVLVAVPAMAGQPKALARVLNRLVQLFGPGQIRFLVRQGRNLPGEVEKGALWEVDPKELRFKRFPTHRLWQRVHTLRAEAFIDLHEEFDLLSAALAVASGARVRLCFAHEQRDPFFNLQVRTSPGLAPAKRYEKLIALLESCRTTRQEAPAGSAAAAQR